MPAKGQRALQLAEFEARLVNIPEIDWARLAAYIDGEGTIYINRTRPRDRHINTTYNLSVLITNSSLPLINWLQKTFGGSAYDKNFHGKNKLGIRPMKTWYVNEGQAATILQHCLPYFIVKHQQAVIGIAFRELKSRGRRGVLVSPEDMAQREELRNKIHLLDSPKFGQAN